MIVALELVKDKQSKEPFTAEEKVGWQIYLAGLKEGLILRPLDNITYLWLPLAASIEQIDEITERRFRELRQMGR